MAIKKTNINDKSYYFITIEEAVECLKDYCDEKFFESYASIELALKNGQELHDGIYTYKLEDNA